MDIDLIKGYLSPGVSLNHFRDAAGLRHSVLPIRILLPHHLSSSLADELVLESHGSRKLDVNIPLVAVVCVDVRIERDSLLDVPRA